MSDKKDTKKKEPQDDKELDDLLDSALQDFSKSEEGKAKKNESSSEPPVPVAVEPSEDDAWTQDFIREATSQFETNMATIFQNMGADVNPDNIQENFQRMAEAAAQVISNPTAETSPQSIDFASTISQTLQNLSLGAENIDSNLENDIMNLFGNQSAAQNQFLPMMQGMMQSLLSKDVLLPSLRDILERFPSWLENNRTKLSESDAQRYENQIKLMNEVCAELEKGNDADADDVKKERYEKVLTLMQKMQELGQPPQEVVGEPLTPGLQFDPQGNPILPPDLDPNNCNLM